MPALPPVPKVVRFVFDQTIGTDVHAVTIDHYQYGGVLSATDLTSWLIAINAAWAANISPLQHNTRTLTGTRGTDLTSPTSPDSLVGTSHPGTRAGEGCGAAECVLENAHIARRYRGGKPRQYWSLGTNEDRNDPNDWGAAFLVAAENGLTAFRNALIAGAPGLLGLITPVAVSYFQGFTNFTGPTGRTRPRSTVRNTPLVDAIITRTVNSHVASQRRRNLIRG